MSDVNITITEAEPNILVTVSGTGATGANGKAGFTIATAIDLSSNHAIASVDGSAVYADNSLNLSTIGLSIEDTLAGGNVFIQNVGKITVTGAGWTPNGEVYLSTIGTLTQTKPTSGIVQILGIAHDTETLIIKITPIIIDGGYY
jgi:hypothetical protein